MGWNNWSSWLKGGLLTTGIINILYYLYSLIGDVINYNYRDLNSWVYLSNLIDYPGRILFDFIPLDKITVALFNSDDSAFFITEIIFYFVVGALIVYLSISEIRWKKSNKNKTLKE